MVSTKKIAKNTLYLYFRMFLIMSISLYTVRLTLKILGVEDFGIFGAIGGVVAAFASLSAVLSGASQRFYSLALGNERITEISTILYSMLKVYLVVIVLIFCLAGTIGGWFVSNCLNYPIERAYAVYVVFYSSLLSFLLVLVASPFQALIIAKEDMGIYAYVSILEVLLKLALVFCLSFIDIDKLVLYGILLLLVQLIISLTYILAVFFKYDEIRTKPHTCNTICKEILTFSGWTLFGSLANMANVHGINILLNIFFGPIVNAAYAIGNQISYAVNSFAVNFFTAVKPGLIKSYASKDTKKMFSILELSSKFSFFLLFIMVLPLCLEIDLVLKIWLGKVGVYMEEFSILMLLYILILNMNNPITTIIQAAGKVKLYHSIIDTFTLLSIPLIIVAIKLGIESWKVFFINIFIFVIAHIIRMQLLEYVTGYSKKVYFKKVLLPIGKLVIFSISICLALKLLPLYGMFTLCKIPLYCFFIMLLGWIFLLNQNERKKIKLVVANKFSKK